MREILFRGKRLHDNKWIYGNFVSDCEGNPHIIEPRFFCEDGHHLQYEDNTDTPVFVLPETVGQFTGVTDMNKKPIFEGDIVVDRTMIFQVIGQIIYNTDKAAFVFKNSVTEESLDKHRWLEIIGNIHDNSELLKEEEISW